MQKTREFQSLVKDRKLSDNCPLDQDKHIEYEMIILMTDPQPSKRPSADEIKAKWLKKWQ